MTNLQKYEQMMRVTTRDDKILYFPHAKYEAFKKALEDNKFVEIEGILMAVWNVKTIQQDKGGDYTIPKEYREQVISRSKIYEENLGKPPTTEVKLAWVEKLQNGKDIF